LCCKIFSALIPTWWVLICVMFSSIISDIVNWSMPSELLLTYRDIEIREETYQPIELLLL
jgi:hypothetical protein